MNKLLPKTKYNQNGFTLVELLVVIVILAVLGVVGVTLFSGTQSRARDSKRKEDIGSMASAMEANYVAGTGYTTTVAATWFADGVIPANPGGGSVTAAYSTGTPTTSTFTFCAALENSTGNANSATGTGMGNTTGAFFCKKNSQ